MVTRKLLATVLIASLVTFFSVPFTAYADGSTSIHVKKTSIPIFSITLTYTVGAPLAFEQDPLDTNGNNWICSDYKEDVLEGLETMTVVFDHPDFGKFTQVYTYPEDFGPRRDKYAPIQLSAQGEGSINIWINKIQLPEPDDGTLIINKQVMIGDEVATQSAVIFEFEIYNSDDILVDTVTASAIDAAEIDLEIGEYYVIETENSAYDTQEADGTVDPVVIEENEETEITFHNSFINADEEPGTLIINKQVMIGDMIATQSAVVFEFEIYNSDDILVDTVTASAIDAAEIDLYDGDYYVVETENTDYDTQEEDGTIDPVVIVEGEETEITFHNSLIQEEDPTSLTIEKTVTNEEASRTLFSFDIYSVDLSDQEEVRTYIKTVTASDLQDGFTELEPGDYVVVERVASNYALADEETGYEYVTLEAGEDDSVDFFNERDSEFSTVGAITIVKEVPRINSTVEFSFHIVGPKLDDDFTLSEADEPQTYSNLPFGTYTVTEEDRSGYNEETLTQTFTINADTPNHTFTFVNRRSGGGGGGGDTPEVLTPEPVPASPVVVIEEPVPAAPLPQTGGFDPSFLYGLGLLLTGSGIAIKGRKK